MLLTDLVKDTRGFKTVNKMKKINKDIRYIKKNDLAETIDNVKMDNSVSFFDMREEIRLSFVNIFNNRREEMNEELAEKLGVGLVNRGNLLMNNSTLLPVTNFSEKIKKLSSCNNAIIQKPYIHDGKVGMCNITYDKCEDYDGIPPENIIQIEKRWRDCFDEIGVLDVKNEVFFDIKRKKVKDGFLEIKKENFIEDPILVGKFNGDDDTFFILGFWLENVSAIEYLENKKQIGRGDIVGGLINKGMTQVYPLQEVQ